MGLGTMTVSVNPIQGFKIHKGFYTICSRPNKSDAQTYWFIRILASYRDVLEYSGLFHISFQAMADRAVSPHDGLLAKDSAPDGYLFQALGI